MYLCVCVWSIFLRTVAYTYKCTSVTGTGIYMCLYMYSHTHTHTHTHSNLPYSGALNYVDHSAALQVLARLQSLGSSEENTFTEPSPPLPAFIEEWLSTFSTWSAEHRLSALDGLVAL